MNGIKSGLFAISNRLRKAAAPRLRLMSRRMDQRPLEIEVWYGLKQVAGAFGQPQPAANILGTACGPVKSLSYRLNGSASQPLAIGPDERRLSEAGDFNIELPYANLRPGPNSVEITALGWGGAHVAANVELDFVQFSKAPNGIQMNWEAGSQPQPFAQIVDGRWRVESGGLRTAQVAYDRAAAFGDQAWQNVEVLVPVTLYRFEPRPAPSNGAGLGIVLRWNGHTDDPVRCPQPRCGWLPQGATVWYGCDRQGNAEHFRLEDGLARMDEDKGLSMERGRKYWFKARVETLPGGETHRYSFSAWADGEEPSGWLMSGERWAGSPETKAGPPETKSGPPETKAGPPETKSGPPETKSGPPETGSILLVAHHADVLFGDLQVRVL